MIMDFKKEIVQSPWGYRIGIFLVIVTLLAVIVAYFLFFYTLECTDRDCYQSALARCRKVFYVREDASAVWFYKIKGKSATGCKVEVALLNLKQGDIELETLQGKTMTCDVYRTDQEFPEKNFARCSGPLREEMQEVIIQRMHNYLIQNIGQINEEFEKV